MRRPFPRLAVPLSSMILLTAAAVAQTADPAGHWEGAIEVPGTPLKIEVDLARDGDKWKGDISIAVQNIADMALANVQFEGGVARFEIPGIPGNPTFSGKLSPDGNTLSGDFTQGGANLTFKLERKASAAAQAGDVLKGFEDMIDKMRTDWEVPGCAVVIVQEDQVVLSRGFGQRDVEAGKPVTPQTLFAIGSCSKAFTTFVMGTLVDDGKLDWNKPVSDCLPAFRVQDEVATRLMTPRDLVTHRSGLPRHDLVWYNSTLTLEQLVARLPHLEPNEKFRSTWQYNNLMYGAAGYLSEKIAGESWEGLVRKRIFEPLGMKRSNFSVKTSQQDADFSQPYTQRDEKTERIPFRDIQNVGPAGSINSCVEDLAAWLIVHLNGGKFGGKSLIQPATLADLHTPQMVIPGGGAEPEIKVFGYACGWMVSSYRGQITVEHGGGIDGFSTLISLVPQKRIGIAVLTNSDESPLAGLVTRHALDRLLKLETRDWHAEALARFEKGEKLVKEGEEKKKLARKTGTTPAHKLEEYAGEYENPGYGNLNVALRDGKLEMVYNGMTAPLEHWHYELFSPVKDTPDAILNVVGVKLMFVTGMDGEVEAVQATMEPSVKPIVFARKPDSRLRDPAYLARFVGEYELASLTVSFALRGTVLTANVPGQPTYELEPTRGDTFNLRGVGGYSVKFVSTDDKVTEAQFHQPNGIFPATRKP